LCGLRPGVTCAALLSSGDGRASSGRLPPGHKPNVRDVRPSDGHLVARRDAQHAARRRGDHGDAPRRAPGDRRRVLVEQGHARSSRGNAVVERQSLRGRRRGVHAVDTIVDPGRAHDARSRWSRVGGAGGRHRARRGRLRGRHARRATRCRGGRRDLASVSAAIVLADTVRIPISSRSVRAGWPDAPRCASPRATGPTGSRAR
jgi:hypothetical protein